MSAASLASSIERQTAAPGPRSEEELDLLLSEPSPAALAALDKLDSDLVILGVSGKMGPTLARMAVRALDQLNSPHRVYGVARFSQPHTRDQLEAGASRRAPATCWTGHNSPPCPLAATSSL